MNSVFTMRVTFKPENPAKWFGDQADIYMQGAQTVFRVSVFKFLEFIIRYGRRRTGRMVSGFTPIMDLYNYNYMRSWQHSDQESANAVSEGKTEGSFIYDPVGSPWNITITNAVEYVGYVEEKVGITEIGQMPVLIPYFEKFIGENFDQFFENANRAFGGPNGLKGYGNLDDYGAPEST